MPAPVAAPSISAERMSEITRVLASDEFQGRSMGGPGEEKTVAYLIEQFQAAGLEPGGENGGWTQTVPMIRTKLQAPMRFSIRKAGTTRAAARSPTTSISAPCATMDQARIANAPMVFVGYGVNAPERGWDDFKGVDLKGKVAVFLVNDPDFEAAAGEPVAGKFGGQTMTYYGRWTYKFEEAARRGAIAALIVHDTAGAGYGWNVVQSAGGRELQRRACARARSSRCCCRAGSRGRSPRRCSSAPGSTSTTLKRQARTRGIPADRPQGDLLGRRRRSTSPG